VVGLETALAVGLELVREERLGPLALVERMSTRPARVMGLSGGTLEPGASADLVLLDPERVFKVDIHDMASRSKNSAFLGRELRGRALRTWVAGRVAFALGEES
jgi:dihydroorotase